MSAATALAATAAHSADSSTQLETITVTGSRLPSDLSTYAGSVTLVSRAQIEQQAEYSPDLGQILASVVPGLAVASSGSYSNFDQTLRGRKPAVFIDGIPVSVTLRDGGRDNRLIGLDAIGSVETISGATAIYGLGGAGGLINYITRTPGQGPAQFQTHVDLGSSLTHPAGSLSWSLGQSALGRIDRFSYVVTGDYQSYSSLFDAEGGRIPPDPQMQGGIADTHTYNVFGKLGYDLTDEQHLYVMGSDYDTLQRTRYSSGTGKFRVSKSSALPVPPPGEPQFTREALGSAEYVNDDLLGSTLDVDAYYSRYSSLFEFYAYPYYPPTGGQTEIDNIERGVRSTVNTPFELRSRKGSVIWGMDYSIIDARQALTDGRVLVPYLRQRAAAPFAQASAPVASWLTLNAGVRSEHDAMSVDTFTTIGLYAPSLPGGNTVQGGTIDYSATLLNAGAVVTPFKSGSLAGASAYASYSEGFSVGDFGRALR
ncbi:MAG: TonB-dependent receptor, partial [Acetobacteraceae bacterium]